MTISYCCSYYSFMITQRITIIIQSSKVFKQNYFFYLLIYSLLVVLLVFTFFNVIRVNKGIKMEVWNQFKKASVWVRVSVYRRYGCHDFKINNGSWSAYFPTTCWFIFFFLPNQSSIKVRFLRHASINKHYYWQTQQVTSFIPTFETFDLTFILFPF